jgi:hypothetical protein
MKQGRALALASLLLGRLDEARRLATRVVESSVSQPGALGEALQLLGDVASHPDRFAVAAAVKPFFMAREYGSRPSTLPQGPRTA